LGWISLEDLIDELVVLLGKLEGDAGIVDRGVPMLRKELLASAELPLCWWCVVWRTHDLEGIAAGPGAGCECAALRS